MTARQMTPEARTQAGGTGDEEMPRHKMPDYPTAEADDWHLVNCRIPRWAVNAIHSRARHLRVENWVVICDWMQRAGRLPTPPRLHPAVYRRYPGIYLPSGMLSAEDPAQLELAAAREVLGSIPLPLEESHPEDVVAEADEAAGRPPRRTSRPREKETAAGGIAAVMRRADQRAKGTRR